MAELKSSLVFHNPKFVGRVAASALSGALIVFGCSSNAQTPPAPFPFVIPWNDSAKTDVDVSFLNSKPAGANGFIRVRSGHFVEEKTGQRIRFVGTQMVAPECFPTHSDAQQVAAHMAKYGINLARLHYFDDMYDGPGINGNIWDPTKPGHRHFDAVKLDRLDYFINELKKNGIYVDMNLKAGRRFTSADGLNPDVDKIDQAKFANQGRVDFFDRDMIALQKEHAKMLLTHVNPYTGNAYIKEPAVLSVELNNENSLSIDYGGTTGVGLLQLPPYYTEELRQMWNTWLKNKYVTTTSLNAGWKAKTTGNEFPELLENPGTLATWTPDNSQKPPAEITTAGEGDTSVITLDVKQAGAPFDSVQLKQDGLTLENDHVYTFRFRAKGNRPVFVMCNDTSDWHVVGAWQPISVTPEWKDYAVTFTAVTPHAGKVRIGFALGENTGTVSLSGISLKEGNADVKLPIGETVESGNISLTDNPTAAQKNDWVHFIADTEVSYAKELRDYIKTDLGAQALVIGSQSSWGGIIGHYRERGMDYTDNHNYWDLNGSEGTSMVHFLGGSDTALSGLAKTRVAGMPFSVSEYSHAMPNEFQAECMPLMGSVAGIQDWDLVNFHAYGPYGDRGAALSDNNTKIYEHFTINTNPGKMGFMPAMALLFRSGLVVPATGTELETLPAKLSDVDFMKIKTAATWEAHTTTPRATLLSKRWEIAYGAAPTEKISNAGTAKLEVQGVDAGNVNSGIFTTDAPGAKVVTGFVAGKTVQVGTASFQFGNSANNFAILTLTSMDKKPLSEAGKSLLTLASRVQNTGQVWAPDHKSLSDWGKGPTLVDSTTVKVAFPTSGAREVRILDATGAKVGVVPSSYKSGLLSFQVAPEMKALWFSIVKP